MDLLQQLSAPRTLGDFLSLVLWFGAVPTGSAWMLFRFLGQKWIENKFAAQLEAEKHEHAKELQELKKRLDAQLSRINKLQDREFQVISDAWDYLQDAEGHVSSLLSIMRSYPDLTRLSADRFEEFLSGSRLTEVHRKEVREAHDRNKHYQELVFWYDLHDAKQAYWKFRSLITKNSIFLKPEVASLFETIAGTMWNGLIAREIGEEAKDMKMWIEASRETREKLAPLMQELLVTVRASLKQNDRTA